MLTNMYNKYNNVSIYLIIVSNLMFIYSENDYCIYNQLQHDKNYYTVDITITHSYIFPVFCEGNISEIDIYAYNSGLIYLNFQNVLQNGTRTGLHSLTGEVHGNNNTTDPITLFLSEPFYISGDVIVITIIDNKSGRPIVKEHISDSLSADDVVGWPGIYYKNGIVIHEHYYSKSYEYQRIPSLQIKVGSTLTTVGIEDTTALSTEMATTNKVTASPSESNICRVNRFMCFFYLLYLTLDLFYLTSILPSH